MPSAIDIVQRPLAVCCEPGCMNPTAVNSRVRCEIHYTAPTVSESGPEPAR